MKKKLLISLVLLLSTKALPNTDKETSPVAELQTESSSIKDSSTQEHDAGNTKEELKERFLHILTVYGECVRKRDEKNTWWQQSCYCECQKELATQLSKIELDIADLVGPLPANYCKEETAGALEHIKSWRLHNNYYTWSFYVATKGEMPSMYSRLATPKERETAFCNGYQQNERKV